MQNEQGKEKVYFDNSYVKVTNSRFIVGSTTYPISNITSVKHLVEHPSKFWPGVMILLGAVLAYASYVNSLTSTVWISALVILGWGIFSWVSLKDTHIVRISTASGEIDALRSKESPIILNIVNALNDAIIERG